MAQLVILNLSKRRDIVKVTPATSLSQVLAEVCKRNQLQPDLYTLRHQQKEVDLSLTFRLSGLASNSTLELRKRSAQQSQSIVNVAFQLQDGSRIVDKFSSTKTVWEILCDVETSKRLNLTRQIDPHTNTFLQPVIQYMTREISSLEELHSTTLATLGGTSSGGISLRLMYKSTSETIDQIDQQLLILHQKKHEQQEKIEQQQNLQREQEKIEQQKKLERQQKVEQQEKLEQQKQIEQQELEQREKLEQQKQFEQQQEEQRKKRKQEQEQQENQEKPKSLDQEKEIQRWIQEKEKEQIEKYKREKKREMEKQQDVGSQKPEEQQPSVSRELKILPPFEGNMSSYEELWKIPESVYKVTKADAKELIRTEKMRKKNQEEFNSVLRTKAMREDHRLKSLSYIQKTIIRVRFPDRYELEAVFHPHETTQIILNIVTEQLVNSTASFYLYTSPPKKLLVANRSLLDQNLIPNALVYFSWENPNQQFNTLLDIRPDTLARALQSNQPIHFVDPFLNSNIPPTFIDEDEKENSDEDEERQLAIRKQRLEQQQQQQQQQQQLEPQLEKRKLPKWFKTGIDGNQ